MINRFTYINIYKGKIKHVYLYYRYRNCNVHECVHAVYFALLCILLRMITLDANWCWRNILSNKLKKSNELHKLHNIFFNMHLAISFVYRVKEALAILFCSFIIMRLEDLWINSYSVVAPLFFTVWIFGNRHYVNGEKLFAILQHILTGLKHPSPFAQFMRRLDCILSEKIRVLH